MDGVGTPIIGRPRPLPGHDTPNAANNTYTLNYEEPDLPLRRVCSLGVVLCVCRSLTGFCVWESGAARNRWVPGRLPDVCCGGVLLSHNLSVAVPLALPGLASRFEMLLGVSPVL